MDFASALAKLEKTAEAASNKKRTEPGAADLRRGRAEYDNSLGEPCSDRPQRRRRYYDHLSPATSLDELAKFGYRIHPRKVGDHSGPGVRPKHLCLLLLCIDSVPYFDLWKAFANPGVHVTDTIVSLVIHAKFPRALAQQQGALRKFIMLRPPRIGRGNSYADPEFFSLSPNWGSVQLTEAMICLLRQGMKIGLDSHEQDERFATRRFFLTEDIRRNTDVPLPDHFVFISESCLPVRSLRECSELIWGTPVESTQKFISEDDKEIVTGESSDPIMNLSTANSKSWLLARNLNSHDGPRNMYERNQFENIHRIVPQFCRWKADQWILLSRQHATACLQVDEHMRPGDKIINSFSRISASDEVYFPTLLAILGILKEGDDTSSEISRQQVTYVDWSEGMRNPASFERGIRDLAMVAKKARDNGSLFARKFVLRHPGREELTGQIDKDEWLQLIEQLEEDDKTMASAEKQLQRCDTK